MKVVLHDITVRDLVKGYSDQDELGVRAYSGQLDVRPPYQREFVYKDKQRDLVIDTLRKDFPLNVMYWASRDNGTYEIIDGQQRTISICQYVDGDFAFQGRYFHNLQKDEQAQVLDYGLKIYICSGSDSEKLDWFRTINIAGAELTAQELRNAVYSGPWVTDAKRYFSKHGCPAVVVGGDYVNKSAIRQELLELAIKWKNNGEIEGYMATHQHDSTAVALWNYFQSVMAWVKANFTNYRAEMKSVPWGSLYNTHQDDALDPLLLEDRVRKLMMDEDVTEKRGIYSYVLNGQERHLSIRQFSEVNRREAYERQGGKCAKCGNAFDISLMHADHIKPWSKGGKTIASNCKMLCIADNREKSDV